MKTTTYRKHMNDFDIMRDKINIGTATKEETEDFFLGPNPRKHKDYKHFRGK